MNDMPGKRTDNLSMDFNQRLKAIKGAGKEVLEEGRVTLLKLTGTGGKAIKALTEKGSLKAETYRVEMEKRYATPEIKVSKIKYDKYGMPIAGAAAVLAGIEGVSERRNRINKEWQEQVEFLTTSHWQGVKGSCEEKHVLCS